MATESTSLRRLILPRIGAAGHVVDLDRSTPSAHAALEASPQVLADPFMVVWRQPENRTSNCSQHLCNLSSGYPIAIGPTAPVR